jgi:hypothetical protein
MLRMLCAKSMQPGAMWLVALSSQATVPDVALNIEEVLKSFDEIYVDLAGYCKWSDLRPAIGQARRSALPPPLPMIHSSTCPLRQADPFPALPGRLGDRRSYTIPWDIIPARTAIPERDSLRQSQF